MAKAVLQERTKVAITKAVLQDSRARVVTLILAARRTRWRVSRFVMLGTTKVNPATVLVAWHMSVGGACLQNPRTRMHKEASVTKCVIFNSIGSGRAHG